MSRQTKVELELKVKQQEEIIDKLNNEIQKLNDENKNQISNIGNDEIEKLVTGTTKLITKIEIENEKLNTKNKELEEEIIKLNEEKSQLNNEIQKLNNELKTTQEKKHNERNGGRKPSLDKQTISKIIDMAEKKITQKEIAKTMNVSIGTVNKIIQNKIGKTYKQD